MEQRRGAQAHRGGVSGSLSPSPFWGWMGARRQLSPTGDYLRNALRNPEKNSRKKQELLTGTLEPVEQTPKGTPYLGHYGGVWDFTKHQSRPRK